MEYPCRTQRLPSGASFKQRPHSSTTFRYSYADLIYTEFDRLSLKKNRPKTADGISSGKRYFIPSIPGSAAVKFSDLINECPLIMVDFPTSVFIRKTLKPRPKYQPHPDWGLLTLRHTKSGRMFCKDKTCTTKGEQDIMLGIFRNRGNTENTQKLEYLVKHNHIKSHREAWNIKEEIQRDSGGVIVNSNKKTEEYKTMMNDPTKHINESNILKISNYSKKPGSPVVSKTGKFKGKISVVPNSKLLRHLGSAQDNKPFFSQPIHRSNFRMGQDELCSKCLLHFQSKPKRDSDVFEESDRNKSKVYQMNPVGKGYKDTVFGKGRSMCVKDVVQQR